MHPVSRRDEGAVGKRALAGTGRVLRIGRETASLGSPELVKIATKDLRREGGRREGGRVGRTAMAPF